MKTTFRILASATFAFLVANHSLHAQLVADGTTASINAVTTNITGNLTIGTNGSFTSLIITNGGIVTNSSSGIIGSAAASKTNRVIVTGASSVWANGTTLVVGSGGSGNLLMVTNGGLAVNSFGNLANNTSSSNNTAIVTGTNSRWIMSNALNVGNTGPSNQLFITAGGRVQNANAQLGNTISSPRNRATVTGPGSTWVNSLALDVGRDSSLNQLTITNGGSVTSVGAYLAGNPSAFSSGSSNSVIVTGTNSSWTNTAALYLGYIGSGNQLTVSNAGVVINSSTAVTNMLGNQAPSLNNAIRVTGTNSLFLSRAQWRIGSRGSLNQLTVQDGGRVESGPCFIGESFDSSNNVAVVTGAGSVWSNTAGIYVGYSGFGNQLVITNSGTVTATNFFVGFNATSSNNFVTVEGGSLIVTNAAGIGVLDVRRGTNELKAGFIEVDRLRVTNTLGEFELTDGTLLTRSTTNDNGRVFGVGVNNGSAPAVFQLAGNGIHFFGNGLSIANSGYLTGNGTIIGDVTVQTLGTLSPGASVGKLVLNNSPALQGKTVMEISRNGSALTNDQVQVAGPLTYGGSLVVSNLGPTALAVGDRFQLFIAASYGGAFAPVTLPALGEGFAWTNKLLVDGSIEVVTNVTRPFGVDVSHFQDESGISQSAWNQMYAEGKRFAFVKATEGLTGPHDATMAVNVQRAAAAGLLVGVYHYAHPENRPTTNGAILEASNMVVYAGSAIGVGRLRPVLDLEGSAANLSTTALTDWVIAFGNEIIARRGPAAAPIIYVTQTFANNELDSRLANYDLWLRTVGSGANPAVDDPPGQGFADATGVFNNWSFWQYSATGSSGGISPLDLDVCHEEFKPLASYVITNVVQSPVQISGMTIGPNGSFQFSFNNAPGGLFTVLASTNVALSLSNWEVVGGVTEVSPGLFQFIDPQATNHVQRFYRVRWP